jgi:hypothetical protein
MFPRVHFSTTLRAVGTHAMFHMMYRFPLSNSHCMGLLHFKCTQRDTQSAEHQAKLELEPKAKKNLDEILDTDVDKRRCEDVSIFM